jgi:3-oxoacyl-[acyl-carrier protein] reductase
MVMDLGLAGRVYVLTGASRGLGYATAECLVADGAHVVIASRDPERVAAASERLNAFAHDVGSTGTARAVAVDNAEADASERLIAAAMERANRLDGALISVGGPPAGPVTAINDDQWRASFETVFLGAVRLARTVAGRLADSGGGAIAMVLSSSVRTPLPGLAISNGLRPGLAALAKELSDAYAPRNVRVVSLMPGRIATDRMRELHAAAPDPDAAMRATAAEIPLRRMAEPQEFGRVAAFVLSPAASYLTGIAVPVDGGLLRTF